MISRATLILAMLISKTAMATFTVAVRVPFAKVDTFRDCARKVWIQTKVYDRNVFVFERDSYEDVTTAMEWFESLTDTELLWGVVSSGSESMALENLKAARLKKFRITPCRTYLDLLHKDLQTALSETKGVKK